MADSAESLGKYKKEGFYIKTYISRVWGAFNRFEISEKIVLINILCIFMPFLLSTASTFALSIYALTKVENRRRITTLPFALYLVIWAVVTLASGLFHQNYIGILGYLLYLSYIVFGLYAFTIMTSELSRRIVQLMVLLSYIAFIVALVQHFMIPDDRVVSTFVNANYYGFICEIIIVVCLYALYAYKKHRLFYGIAVVLNAVGLWMSGCRSAWPAVLCGAIVIFICFRAYRVLIGLLCAGAAAGVALFFDPQLIPRWGSMDSTTSLRYKIYDLAWHGFLSHPIFGQGFLAYWKISHGLGRADQPHAHNILLNAMDCYGIIGLILLAVFLVPAIINGIKKLKAGSRICILVFAVAVAVAVHSITDDPALGMQTGIFTMILLAMGGEPLKSKAVAKSG